MALTNLQRQLRKDAEEVAEMAKIDFWNIEKADPEARTPLLRIAVSHIVVAAVVTEYTLLDEILSSLICRYYFQKGKKKFHLWDQKKFRAFVHYGLDEMYLLKKIDLVHAIKPLPSEVREILRKLNAIRNAVAHSFFPENRKEYRKSGKILYEGGDIRTAAGMKRLLDDCHRVWVYLAARTYDTWYDDSGLPPITD
jgi:hypothetical protein